MTEENRNLWISMAVHIQIKIKGNIPFHICNCEQMNRTVIRSVLNKTKKRANFLNSAQIACHCRWSWKLLQNIMTGDGTWVYGYNSANAIFATTTTKKSTNEWVKDHDVVGCILLCKGIVQYEFVTCGKDAKQKVVPEIFSAFEGCCEQEQPWLGTNHACNTTVLCLFSSLLISSYLA